ncbi:MAG: ribosomal protein S18-alanine N-acetyltransferase [Actinobacteria bacterium]|nr:ribosomal protein S18-alanine N-acetyltransferase [Actinomycetota bacterium]
MREALVRRPPQPVFDVGFMQLADLPQVRRIERESFPSPWPRDSYRRELEENERARYIVVRRLGARPDDGASPRRRFPLSIFSFGGDAEGARDIVGYAGVWLMIDEAHITTIAVGSLHRGVGLGELLLIHCIKVGRVAGAERMTLEVRVSNTVAQRLYHKYGFFENGVRPRYYSDDLEDALIMWSGRIDQAPFTALLAEREAALVQRLRWRSRL